MKRTAIILALVMLVSSMIPSNLFAQEPNVVAAIMLSAMMPGVGEWYNSGFQGSFPLGECIFGYICFCVQLSSIIDAAAGKTEPGARIDFWGAV